MGTFRGYLNRHRPDLALAAAVCAFILIGASKAAANQFVPRPLDAGGYALSLVAGGVLALRRSAPPVTLGIVALAVGGYLGFGYPFGPTLLPFFVAMYTVASIEPPRRSLVMCGLAAVVLGGLTAAGPHTDVNVVPWLGWFAVPWTVGTLRRLHRESVDRQRAEQLRELTQVERLRVAREVHDVVGHGLAVINMQAGVALHVLEKRPEQAAIALAAIKQTSKAALDDLRATLAVFRQDEGSAPREPGHGVADVPALVAAMPSDGPEVRVVTTGAERPVPAVVGAAAYRIVQESLTNALRHAHARTVEVHVGYGADDLVVEVVDDGRGTVSAEPVSGGHGIAGMRERAESVGGTLDAGPRPTGGFAVRAWLPARATS